MAQIPYRANLSACVFPLRVADAGRTVIIPGADQNYDKRVDNTENKAAGIPQAIYMENVLPTVNGYQSIGFEPANGITVAGRQFRAAVQVPSPAQLLSFYSYPKDIELVFWSDNTISCNFSDDRRTWINAIAPGFLAPADQSSVSVASVRGVVYLYSIDFSGVGRLFTVAPVGIDSAQRNLTDVTASLMGIASPGLLGGIAASFNYLLTFDRPIVGATNGQAVYWSSTTTPTDFVASLITGAGNEIVGSLTTHIGFLRSSVNGFFIYTGDNVTAATYTGNSRYPWKFREITNSGGYRFSEQVFSGPDSITQVGIDNSGKIQFLGSTDAEVVLPEITSFFERSRKYDEFNTTTHVFSESAVIIDGPITPTDYAYSSNRRVFYLLDRYLIISYGAGSFPPPGYFPPPYRFALVYDTALKRYGKLKLDHTYIFTSSSNIYILNTATGVTVRLSFDVNLLVGQFSLVPIVYSSILILGKFQLIRDRLLQIEDLDIECAQNSGAGTTFSVFLLPSMDGKNFDASITPYERTPAVGKLRQYLVHKVAKNWCVGIKGAFDVSTVEMKFIPHGHS